MFNGDIADRGEQATQIYFILFAIMLVQPNCVYINRGNHEVPVAALSLAPTDTPTRSFTPIAVISGFRYCPPPPPEPPLGPC